MEINMNKPTSVDELKTLYASTRAGHDPDTKQLHITEDEFVATINRLITEARLDENTYASVAHTRELDYFSNRNKYLKEKLTKELGDSNDHSMVQT